VDRHFVMRGLTRRTRQIERYGEIRHRGEVEVHGITHRQHARREQQRRLAAERQDVIRGWRDHAIAFVHGDVGGADVDGLRAEHVGQRNAEPLAAKAPAHNHPQRLILE
jgi:hypothetical protein